MAINKTDLTEEEALEAASVATESGATDVESSTAEATEAEASEEELTAEDIFPCEDDDEVEEECIDTCPDCIPDPEYPAYMVPNWRNRTLPYLDKRNCMHCVTVWTPYTQQALTDLIDELYADAVAAQSGMSRDDVYNQFIEEQIYSDEDYLIDGIAKILKANNKSLDWSNYTDYCEEIEEYIDSRAGGGPTISDDAESESDDHLARAANYATAPAEETLLYGMGTDLEQQAMVASTTTGPDGEELDTPAYQSTMVENWTGARYFWDEDAGWLPEREFWSNAGPTDSVYEDRYLLRGGSEDQAAGLTDASSDDAPDWGGTWADYLATAVDDGEKRASEESYYESVTYSLRLDPKNYTYVYNSESKEYIEIKWDKFESLYADDVMIREMRTRPAYGIAQPAELSNRDILTEAGKNTDEFRLHRAEKIAWKFSEVIAEHYDALLVVGEEEEEEYTEDEGTEMEGYETTLGQSFDPGEGEKTTTARTVTFTENSDFFTSAEWRDTVADSVTAQYLIENNFVSVTEHYISPVEGTRMRILVCIPADVLWQIPESTEDPTYTVQEEEGVEVTLPYEVEFTSEDVVDGLFSNTVWLLKHYANKRIPLSYEADGQVVIETYENTGIEAVEEKLGTPSDDIDYEAEGMMAPNRMSAMFEWNAYLSDKWGKESPEPYHSAYAPADVKKQAENINEFKGNLLDFLNKNVDGWVFSFLSEHNKKSGVERIKIEFTSQYHIKAVTYNKSGCPPVTLTGQKRAAKMIAEAKADPEYQANPWMNPQIVAANNWDEFAYSYPQTDPRTMAYVASLPFINDVAMATTPMEWQDFITLWTYPQVAVGDFNELRDNDPNASCMDIGGALSNILTEGVDVFFEVLLGQFDKNLCRAITDQVVDDFAPDLKSMSKMAVREILENDPFISDIMSAMLFVRNIDDLWRGIINELGLCGMLGLLQTLFDCLFSGVEWNEILEKVIRSALEEMDIQFFQRLLIGLPPHVQDQIAEHARDNLSEELADYRPWAAEGGLERNAQAVYNSQMKYEENNLLSSRRDTYGASEYTAADGETYTSVDEAFKAGNLSETDQEALQQRHETVSQALEEMTETTTESLFGVEYERSYQGTEERKQSKTLGAALSDSIPMEEIRGAYINALMEFLAPEELMDLLETIPGFTFLKMLGDLLKCPGVTLFHPPLKSWFNDLAKMISEWDLFCEGIKWIGPPWPISLPPIFNIMKALAELLLEALEAAIVQALVTMLKMLLEWIFGVLCSLMGVLGAAALAAVGLVDQTEFMDILKDKLCTAGDTTDAEVSDALATILSALGATDATTPEEVSAVGEEFKFALLDYVGAAPAINTLELLNGTPSDRTLIDTAEFFENREDSFSETLSNPRTVKKIFNTLGQTFLGPDVVDTLRDSIIQKVQCDDGAPYCDVESGRDAVKEVFCRFNLPETECENMANQTLADFDNLTNDMLKIYNNPNSVVEPNDSDMIDPCNLSDDGTYWPKTDEISEAAMAHQATSILGLLQAQYEAELVDDGGMFDRILSDCDGRGKQKHDREMVNLLEKEIAGNPTTVGKYLKDIITGERTDIAVSSGQSKGISAGDSVTKAGGTFEWIDFDANGVGYGPLGSSIFRNGLPVFEIDGGDGITDNIYAWSYGRVWQDNYKMREDLSRSQMTDYDCEEGQWDVWDTSNAYVKVDTRKGREQRYKYEKDKEKWRNYKLGADEYELYPEPHARMIFLGTDPSLGDDSAQEAGMPAYYFHYWHYEKYEREESGVGWNSATEELTKDAAKMHIFSLMPEQDTPGYTNKQTRGDKKGEFTVKYSSFDAEGCSADAERNGNIETFFRGFGPLSNNSQSKSALNPFIKVSRDIDPDILSHIADIGTEAQSGKPQQASVWAQVVKDSVLEALQDSEVTLSPHVFGESGQPFSPRTTDTEKIRALDELYDDMLSSEYSKITESFLSQYGKQISDNENMWKSGLLNFELVELSEDECIDLGLSKNKGDDEDKKEIPLPRPSGKKKLRHGSYRSTNSENTGWYRPEVKQGTGGISENVDLPEDEYGLAAFYIHQQYQRGWARVADEYLPGPANPCEEQVSADMFDWEGIADHISDANIKIDNDERVSANPSCVWDPPFNRVNTKQSKAKMEGLIKATMRVSIFESMIKGMPSFTKFNPSTGCYGDLVSAYIFTIFRSELFHQSRRTYLFGGGPGKIASGYNRHDYKFLEQCCNMYTRLVARGDIEASSEALEAIDAIDAIINKVYYEPHIDLFRAKRKALRRAVWEKAEEYSTIITKELFRHELETSTEKFANWAQPEVDNLQLHFLSGKMNLDDAPTSATVTDVAKWVRGPEYESRFISEGELTSEFKYLENGGFILEKYIKIEDYTDETRINPTATIEYGASVTSRDEWLHNIVNLGVWKDWVADKDNFVHTTVDEESGAETENSYKISDLFYRWSYGLRLCYVPSSFVENASWHEANGDSTGACGLVGLDVAEKYKAFRTEGVPLIPIASTEIEIPAELKINNFDIVDDYDLECLMQQFIGETEFRTLFEYVFPLDRLLSVPTIYVMHCFLDSIGLDDGWYQDKRQDPDDDSYIGDPVDGTLRRFMRKIQHQSGPGLKTGDFLLFTDNLKRRHSSFRAWPGQKHLSGLVGPDCFVRTREALRNSFESEYHFAARYSGSGGLPKFRIRINLPPWSLGLPRFFKNRQLEGPECEDAAAAAAEAAAYNRL